MIRPVIFAIVLITTTLNYGAFTDAGDWPQWNGPNRDGTVPAATLSFPSSPAPVWSVDVGLGYSGPIVVGDRVVVTDYLLESGTITNNAGKRDELTGKERITCLDKKTGTQLWQHSYDRPYRVSYPSGPRTTPVVHNGFVYALGSEGDLKCLSLQDGTVSWQVSFTKQFGAKTPLWGHAASPLVYGNTLVCMVGGEGSLVVAFDLRTGEVKWKALTSEDNETGYCPPVIIRAGKTDQLLVWSPTTISSLDPSDGSVYWQEALVPDYGMSILPPVTDGKLLFVSGEGSKSAMFRLSNEGPSAELMWRGAPKDSLYLATSNAIFKQGYVYGADIRSGTLICFEAESGERKWRTAVPTTGSTRGRGGAHASAFLIQVGEETVILSETGDLIHARLTPERYEEMARFHAIDPTTKTMGRTVLLDLSGI